MISPILTQIANSKLSKQGQTNLTGVFEGTPTNAAIVQTLTNPSPSSVITAAQNPTDAIYQNFPPQKTYLDYLQTVNKV